ncbi:P-loop containing nucleoside triphosphate hydrolase protein [Podospora didyma]|uniref:P-loop containing nucleoside triphosphate hydrolase protein n=1 Tax=Podospora didyma TaxID=330526 RepID=A0AAE0U1U7_9PEZI|nr:P-loop containing nucleoside triphosphate hydrolase protein [Podospora didyma]
MPGTLKIPLKMEGGRPLPAAALRPASRPSSPATFNFGADNFSPFNIETMTPFQIISNNQQTQEQSLKTKHRKTTVIAYANEMTTRAAVESDPISPSSSSRADLLYGHAIITGGEVTYKTSRRLENWLASLEPPLRFHDDESGPSRSPSPAISPVMVDFLRHLSLNDRNAIPCSSAATRAPSPLSAADGKKPVMSSPMNLECINEEAEGARAAQQRSKRHSDDSYDQPSSKRSRFSDSIRQTLSRLSGRRTSFEKHPASASARSNPGPSAHTSRNTLSRMSRVTGFQETLQTRNIKICLLGDTNSGKTALAIRLTSGFFHEQKSRSISTDVRIFSVAGDDGEILTIELWDFPGRIATHHNNSQLMEKFFHAVVICYNIEDASNLKSILEVWKPKLETTLLGECPLFVLGLKKDTRPDFPTLGLSFLPKQEPASAAEGRKIATLAHAQGFAECSAKTGENVQEAWHEIVNFVIAKKRNHKKNNSKGINKIFLRGESKGPSFVLAETLSGFYGGVNGGGYHSRNLSSFIGNL